MEVWEVTEVEEWEVVVVLFLSVLVTGNVARKDADTTISRRTSAVCDVERAVQELQLLLTLAILLLWMLRLITAWDLALWLEPLVLAHSHLLLEGSVRLGDTVVSTSVAHQAPTHFHPVLELPLVLIHL